MIMYITWTGVNFSFYLDETALCCDIWEILCIGLCVNNCLSMSRELDTIQVDHKDAEDSNITRIDYFISILIVCISGNPAIVMGTPWYGVFAVFIMLLICLVFRRPFVNVTFIKWMLGFLFLFIFILCENKILFIICYFKFHCCNWVI